ncbi:MAG: peptide chain release factor N(5)-glutamine methyltransferase [Coriobacteriia bacterium]|jgi:release factor glutamine methyltransferase|nr:peptide chain release factor N(5)-glutamine methyltransferase [Coriobacteriia bacterium]
MGARVWTVKDALDWTVAYFEREGVEAPRRSAEWLLSAATGLSRVEVYAYHERPLADGERGLLREGVRRRASGEPLQYVTGEMPFRHLILRVRPGVFIPRPETEILVDVALEALVGVEEPLVLEACTGSGCIACAIATERTDAQVVATEISAQSAVVARENVERFAVTERVSVHECDLFTNVPHDLRGKFDLVVSNPPYIPSRDLPDLPPEVHVHEPHLALDGGHDGLDVVRRIASESLGWLKEGGVIAVEIDETCGGAASKGLREWYQEVRVVRDLAGRDRIVTGQKPKVRQGQGSPR